jgi:hypothetical protein
MSTLASNKATTNHRRWTINKECNKSCTAVPRDRLWPSKRCGGPGSHLGAVDTKKIGAWSSYDSQATGSLVKTLSTLDGNSWPAGVILPAYEDGVVCRMLLLELGSKHAYRVMCLGKISSTPFLLYYVSKCLWLV